MSIRCIRCSDNLPTLAAIPKRFQWLVRRAPEFWRKAKLMRNTLTKCRLIPGSRFVQRWDDDLLWRIEWIGGVGAVHLYTFGTLALPSPTHRERSDDLLLS